MRHKDDSTQENKGHGYNLDHRTTRFCAPGPRDEHFGTKFRIVPSSLTLLRWTLSRWTRRWRAEIREALTGLPAGAPERGGSVTDSPDSFFSAHPAPDAPAANRGLWTGPGGARLCPQADSGGGYKK